MRLTKLVRSCLVCALALLLWMGHSSVRAQYGGDCSRWSTIQECCDDYEGNQYCAHDNCIDAELDYLGDGYQTTQFESANCTTEYGAPPGSCKPFSDFVPVDNLECQCSGDNGICYSDDDCCDDLICSNDITGEPNGRCESLY